MKMKDFKQVYADQGAYHSDAKGFKSWFLEDNYRAIADFCHPGRVLDLGCGEGCLADYIEPEYLTGIDYSEEALAMNKALYPGRYAELFASELVSIGTLALNPNSFDSIVCSLTLMYLEKADLDICLQAVKSLLNRGANFIITYPTVSHFRQSNPEAAELMPDMLSERITANGFHVQTIKPFCPLVPVEVIDASTDINTYEKSFAYYQNAKDKMTMETSYHFVIEAIPV
jgi:SAM-dependent methyltransferase